MDVLAFVGQRASKKPGAQSGPPALSAAVSPLRQIKKGTDVPRAIAPRGATNRSRIAAGLARFVQFISAYRLLKIGAR